MTFETYSKEYVFVHFLLLILTKQVISDPFEQDIFSSIFYLKYGYMPKAIIDTLFTYLQIRYVLRSLTCNVT